ncbi:primosomal protein N' [Hyphococcus luteus]|uniref:Replication restart protein PriA n=1 Tax=Hyphococcus luteus TaxID=2058213 RepID=A0A2S7K8I2_9PROT|nr:primosomal protein N' [Marinicaulis flavus]PQA88806.1 primosomal protein N' [Marinicaulis flavus]
MNKASPRQEKAKPEEETGETARISVLFPLPLPKAYDYLCAAPAPPIGGFVAAPFGPREVTGVVWPSEGDALAPEKMKAISAVFDAPPLSRDVVDFVDWAAAYTMFPKGAVLRMVMRVSDALEGPRMQTAFVKRQEAPDGLRLTSQRKAVLAAAGEAPLSAAELAGAAGVSEGVVRGLADAGALAKVEIDPDPPFVEPDLTRAGHALSEDQQYAAQMIGDVIAEGGHKAVLIDGVTGSGKTEVYFEAAAAALQKDPEAQVLILLPEIALTLPFLSRVEERFGAAPAPWHSDLTGAQRRRTWRRVAEGQARLVVGARSALFLPFKKLRLIVVDEEHDNAYKQEEGVIYHARDLSVARGSLGGFPVVLASATPSLETVVNVDEGRYEAVGLSSRFADAAMPDIALIDMREDPPEAGKWLSPVLVDAVSKNLSVGEQSLLFLNRRGYAPLTLCRRCGHKMTAPGSDTMLVEHRFENRLVCHHTGFSMPKPSACPICNAVDSLAPCGPGVERVAEETKERWPAARIAVLSSDTAPGPGSVRAVLDAMREGDIDILIATQVAAKGHHFPNLTLVGVVDADLGLAGGDLRAAERTYQLLSQVTGRAGRAEKPGRALLQTYQPQAPVLAALASGDRDAFLAAEAAGRSELGFPPYGRLAAITLRSLEEKTLEETARRLRAAAPNAEGVDVLGPARAPIYRLRGMARMRLLVKTRKNVHLQAYLADWLKTVKIPGAVRVSVDINPYSFL